MPSPKRGDKGAVYMAHTPGGALVKITGPREASYDPGQAFAEAHGMDAAHGYDVPVKSKPKISFARVWDYAQTTLLKALNNTEAEVFSLFCWYPLGETALAEALTTGVSGSCWVKTDMKNSLTEAIMNAVELTPAQPDWARFGTLLAPS